MGTTQITEQIPGEIEFSDNNILGHGGHAIQCDYTNFELSDSAFTGGISTHTAIHSNGYILKTVVFRTGYTNTVAKPWGCFQGDGCTVLMEDITATNFRRQPADDLLVQLA